MDSDNDLLDSLETEFWTDVESFIDCEFWDKDGLDIERDLRKWLFPGKHKGSHDDDNDSDDPSDDDDDDGDGGVLDTTLQEDGGMLAGNAGNGMCGLQVRCYEHYRTRIGSPSINRHSFTDEEMGQLDDENDGFPLPSTDAELRAFDKNVFIETADFKEKLSPRKRTKKRDRQRSKSATAIPDLSSIRLKLQKLQSPGKPKFLEHLINRVVSRKVGKPDGNGVITNPDESPSNIPDELLSPDSEKCLQQAEAIVEELLACSARPPSGDSSDSGKGSLLESTSDFSPTTGGQRKSWSTPASPTFQGIVKERLKSFQVLAESGDSESVTSNPGTEPTSPLRHRSGSKSFKNEEFELEIREINKSIKTFYTAISNDESFNSAVMESGYVKALVAKINDNKIQPGDDAESEENGLDEEDENGEGLNDELKLNIGKEDSGWNEWEQEIGGGENEGDGNSTSGSLKSSRSSSRASINGVTLRSKNTTPTPSARTSSGSSVSLPIRGNSVNCSRTNSTSESSESHVSKALRRFNQERNKSIPQSRLNSFVSTSAFSYNNNSHIKSPPKLRSLKLNNGDSNSKNYTNGASLKSTNGANKNKLACNAKNRNCVSCDIESAGDQSAGQNGCHGDKQRGCVSQSLDFGLLPLNPADLFDEHWSKSDVINFDDFDLEDNCKQKDEDEKPKDRLHQIAFELLTTERAYVGRLHLLDQVFSSRVTAENKTGNLNLPAEAISQMFSNVQPIYRFHTDFLLPQLEDRMKNWSKERKIGDIMANLAPFLLLYTEYVKNYDNAMAMIDKWSSQSPKFAALLQEIQMLPECGLLTLQHHMLEPIQRVPRYELLLKDYIKHLEQDASDRKDAQKALDRVTQAACHSNTAMKKLDKFHKLLTIIPKLNGEGINDLVSPTRELVKEGPITKISARSSEKQARYIFLFNDLLLVCSEQIMGSYKLRARLSVDGMEMLPGENITIANTFCVKCIEKNIEFLDDTNNGNGLDWLATFQQVITDFQSKAKVSRLISNPSTENSELENSLNGSVAKKSPLGRAAPMWEKDESVSMCMSCQDKFTKIKRRHHCRACGKVFCNKCTSERIFIPYEKKVNRVCRTCFTVLKGESDNANQNNEDTTVPPSPTRPTDVKADKNSIMASYVNIMDKDKKWSRRWITVHEDFVMYFYKKHKDPKAIQTLPLPGHSIKIIGDLVDRPNLFSLMHKDIVVCNFQTDNEEELQQWVKVLEKMVKLELPDSEPKRMSTHSDSSSQSNQSTGSSDQSSQL